MKIELDKTFHFHIDNVSFGDIPTELLYDLFKDGRFASKPIEVQLSIWFPELKWVKGCKDHDHIDSSGRLFEARGFTKNGSYLYPSKMRGGSRIISESGYKQKAGRVTYAICDINDFPSIRVRFIEGSKAREIFGREIKFKDRQRFFGGQYE
jgi:hypothetical protein